LGGRYRDLTPAEADGGPLGHQDEIGLGDRGHGQQASSRPPGMKRTRRAAEVNRPRC
jgi:hypothetical protein